jgi:predicted Zn-dependent protease
LKTFTSFIALMIFAVGGCSDVRQTLSPPVETPSLAPRTVGADTPARREHHRILASYGGTYEDKALEKLLTVQAAELARASAMPGLTYRVTILNSPSVNAFALPSGDLYVTRGLIALANDTSEIAAVLAHEIGHVAAGHSFARADKERQAVLVSRVVSDVLNDPNAGAMALARSRLSLASFSRDQELEADQIGVRILATAHYDPYGSARFLTTMGRNGELRAAMLNTGSDENLDFLSNHPATPERITKAEQAAQRTGAIRNGNRDRSTFLRAIDGMVYGDDPAQGYVRSNRFIHPQMGFTFEAPSGFILENTADSIVGTSQDMSAFRMDSVPVQAGRNLSGYLQSGIVENVKIEAPQYVTIHGLPAVLATAKGQDWTFLLAAIEFNGKIYRTVYASQSFSPSADERFRAAIHSFRPLTTEELTELRPQRLAVMTVKSGDTLASVASRMAVSSRQMEQFLVLNALQQNTILQPGDQVKIVID